MYKRLQDHMKPLPNKAGERQRKEFEDIMAIPDAFCRSDSILKRINRRRVSESTVAKLFGGIVPEEINHTFYNMIRTVLTDMRYLSLPFYKPYNDTYFYDTDMVKLSDRVKSEFITGDRDSIIFPNEAPCPVAFCPFYKQNCVLKFMVATSKSSDYSRLEHPRSKICHFIDYWYGTVQKKKKWTYVSFRGSTADQIREVFNHRSVWMGYLVENEGLLPMLKDWSYFTVEGMLQMHSQLKSQPYIWIDIMFRLLMQTSEEINIRTEVWSKVLDVSGAGYLYLKDLSDYLLSNKVISRYRINELSSPSTVGIYKKELDKVEMSYLAQGIIRLTVLDFNECSRLAKPMPCQGDRNITVDALINELYKTEQFIFHDISRIRHRLRHAYCYTKAGTFRRWTYQHLVGGSNDMFLDCFQKNLAVKLVLVFDSDVALEWQETDI